MGEWVTAHVRTSTRWKDRKHLAHLYSIVRLKGNLALIDHDIDDVDACAVSPSPGHATCNRPGLVLSIYDIN
jgi:hypothetical protein